MNKSEYRKTVEYNSNLEKIVDTKIALEKRRRLASRVKGLRLVSYLKKERGWTEGRIKNLLKLVKPNALELID